MGAWSRRVVALRSTAASRPLDEERLSSESTRRTSLLDSSSLAWRPAQRGMHTAHPTEQSLDHHSTVGEDLSLRKRCERRSAQDPAHLPLRALERDLSLRLCSRPSLTQARSAYPRRDTFAGIEGRGRRQAAELLPPKRPRPGLDRAVEALPARSLGWEPSPGPRASQGLLERDPPANLQ